MQTGFFTFVLAVSSYVLFIAGYLVYGRFLARHIFNFIDGQAMPSCAINDGRDFVPSRRAVLFGHHFTSIAGAGPIIGPAIAVVWGWFPALLWVVFGAIFMGAVHDFCSLAVSVHNRGRSLVDISREVMNPRIRIIFFLFIFIALTIVLAVFLYVMAKLFITFPHSVLPVWLQIPVAIWLGYMLRRNANLYLWGLLSLGLVIATLWFGEAFMVWDLQAILPAGHTGVLSPYFIWVLLLLIYCFVASVIPVHWLLQPRDFLNSLWLYLGMGGVFIGFLFMPQPMADPAPFREVTGLPPIFPLLFVTVACGAVSGFHCLVSSGTTSKQLASSQDALPIGYGAMLLEGALAVLVIVACCSGVGAEKWGNADSGYGSWAGATKGAIGTFISGSAFYLSQLGIPLENAKTIMAVILVSFCGTTLDTATRIQRYVVSELAESVNLPALAKPFTATTIACGSALALSIFRDPESGVMGSGGYILWPLFGNINQMLACLALLVGSVYLARLRISVVYTLIPSLFMLVTTGYAIFIQTMGFLDAQHPNYLLFVVSLGVIALEGWMLVEGFLVLMQCLNGKTEPVSESALP